MFFAILFAVLALFVGSIFYVVLFKPFEDILNATEGMWNATSAGVSAMGQLHSAWLWFPVILFIAVAIYLLIKFQEERVYGHVHQN